MANDPYAEFTADLSPASKADPYVEFTSDLPVTKPPIGKMTAFGVAQDLAPWNIVKEATFGKAGEKVAEAGGKAGYPGLGAWMGTGVSMIPDTAAALMSWPGIHNVESPIVKGLVNSPQELGPEFEAQNQAIGITRRVPQEGGAKPTFESPYQNTLSTRPPRALPVQTNVQSNLVGAEPLPSNVPIRYPSKPGDFMAYANNRLKFGTQLNPQELMDWQVKLQTDMSNGTIPKIDPSTGKVTTIFQQASDLKNRIGSVFNQIASPLIENADIPEGMSQTRPDLNQAYGVASKQQAIQNLLKKVPALAGEGATGLWLLKKALGYVTGKQ